MINKPHTYDARQHQEWGNHIGVQDWERGKIYGHLRRKPRVGDRIRFAMHSGQVLETEVSEVTYPGDPRDMFFATVKPLGSVEAIP